MIATDWWVVSAWIIGAVGLVIGLVGLYAWLHPRPITRRLSWLAASEALLSNDVDAGIEVRVDGTPAAQLTACRVFFVNAGAGSIRAEDLTETEGNPAGALRLAFPTDASVLRVRVVAEQDHVMPSASIAPDGTCTVCWSVLEPKDSFEVVVLHAGTPEDAPTLHGHVHEGTLALIGTPRAAGRATVAEAVVDLAGLSAPSPMIQVLVDVVGALFGRSRK